MSDITMCSEESCPSRLTCYRFIAKPSANQSYAYFERKFGEKKCGDYIEAKAKSQVRRLNVQTARWSDKIRFTDNGEI